MCSKRGERKSGRKTPRKGDLDFIPAPDSELTLMDDYQHDETVSWRNSKEQVGSCL